MKGKSRFPQNLETANRIAYLVAGHIRGGLTDDELAELEAWLNESEHNRQLFTSLVDEATRAETMDDFESADTESYLEKSKAALRLENRRRTMRLLPYGIAIAAAACAIWFFMRPGTELEPQNPKLEPLASQEDILPGVEQAILTLAEGREVRLGDIKGDSVLGAATVHGGSAELEYTSATEDAQEQWHLLSIPRKGFFKLRLSDGTQVWLNAESSIRYPAKFTGKERRVELSGEAYFEIVHNEARPFVVQIAGMEIHDLGTAFNVNGYSDEPVVTTSLVHGRVELLQPGGQKAMLKPGQEAQWGGQRFVVKAFDTTMVAPWKKGEFKFSNTPLETILRQVARWYDAEIVYEQVPKVWLNGTISRDVPVSKLLSLLSKTGEAQFRIEGQKIIVSK